MALGNVDRIIRTTLLLCVLGSTCCILPSCRSSKLTQKVGQHTVVIVETHLFSGGGSNSMERASDGQYEWFKCEMGNLKVSLEDEVLTVNGKKYTLAHKDDSITITNGRVKINGKRAKPDK